MEIIELDSIKNYVNDKYGVNSKWSNVYVDNFGNVDLLHSGQIPRIEFTEEDGFISEDTYEVMLFSDDFTDGGISVEGALNGVLVVRGNCLSEADINDLLKY